MATHYSSFLVRHYLLGRGDERIEIEHVQSGVKARVTSLDAATAWIRAQMPPLSRAPPQAAAEETPPHRREAHDCKRDNE
jgi:hypothetical protein